MALTARAGQPAGEPGRARTMVMDTTRRESSTGIGIVLANEGLFVDILVNNAAIDATVSADGLADTGRFAMTRREALRLLCSDASSGMTGRNIVPEHRYGRRGPHPVMPLDPP